MLKSKKEISKQQVRIVYGMLTTPVLAIAGVLTNILPSVAITPFYTVNEYGICASQLLGAGITPQATAQGCSSVVRPKDLSDCVVTIKKHTTILPGDALAYCEDARRPKELATCVVGISQNTKNAANPAVLNYCGRSLLPVTYGQCVVGLRRKIDISPQDALDTCIDASDRAGGIAASTIPPTKQPASFTPTFETKPTPVTPGNP